MRNSLLPDPPPKSIAATEDRVFEIAEFSAEVRAARFVPGSSRLVCAGHDNTVRVIDYSRGLGSGSAEIEKTIRGHGEWVRSCAALFSPDSGRLLVLSGGFDGRVLLTDAEGHEDVPMVLRETSPNKNSSERLVRATVSPDGRWLATANEDGLGPLWDLKAAGGPAPQFLEDGHDLLTTSGLVFDDGKKVLTALERRDREDLGPRDRRGAVEAWQRVVVESALEHRSSWRRCGVWRRSTRRDRRRVDRVARDHSGVAGHHLGRF